MTPSRLSLLMMEAPTLGSEGDHPGAKYRASRLEYLLNGMMPPLSNPRLRLLMGTEPESRRHQTGVVLFNDTDENNQDLAGALRGVGHVYSRVAFGLGEAMDEYESFGALTLLHSAMLNLSDRYGVRDEYMSVLSEDVRSRASSELHACTFEDYIESQMASMTAATNFPETWRNFVDGHLCGKLQMAGKDLAVVVMSVGLGIKTDYRLFLRRLESLAHEKVCFVLHVRRELLQMLLMRSYIRSYGDHVSEEMAQFASYNAQNDMERYTQLW